MENNMSEQVFVPRTQESVLAEKEGLKLHTVEDMSRNDREKFLALLDKHHLRMPVNAEDL